LKIITTYQYLRVCVNQSISNRRVMGMRTKDIDIYSKSSSRIVSISEC
jgi:hypothetical protein